MTTRRNFLGTIGTGTAVGILTPAAFLQMACGENADRQIGFVIDAFDEAMPILKDLLPGSVALLSKALVVAKDLRQALKDRSPDALGFLQQLIAPNGLVNQIVDTFGVLQDVNQRRILSGIFLIANIALSVIASQLEQVSTAATRSAAKGANASAAAAVEGLGQSDKLEQLLKAARF